MGKLLRKLVNGIVPSWLTKIKSSVDASPKKLLPSFRAGTLSSASPPSSTPNNTGVLLILADPPDHTDLCGDDVLAVPDRVGDDEELPSAAACGGNTGISEIPSSIKEGRTTSIGGQKADKNSRERHREDHDDTHRPHLEGGKAALNGSQDIRNHDTRSSNPSSTRKQEMLSIDKGNDEYGDHQQKQHRNHEDLDHRVEHHGNRNHRVEHHGNRDNRRGERKSRCMQEDEPKCYRIQKKDRDGAGAHNGDDYHGKGYRETLGFKRKSQYLREKEGGEDDDDDDDDDDKEDGSSSSSSSMTGWGWKRRKGERGVMSCELPESICCIVGNSKAVVKHSQDPHLALWESMVEMIVGNGLWELGSLEFLLFCYLSLNEPHLHSIIQSSFLQVLKDLERTS